MSAKKDWRNDLSRKAIQKIEEDCAFLPKGKIREDAMRTVAALQKEPIGRKSTKRDHYNKVRDLIGYGATR